MITDHSLRFAIGWSMNIDRAKSSCNQKACIYYHISLLDQMVAADIIFFHHESATPIPARATPYNNKIPANGASPPHALRPFSYTPILHQQFIFFSAAY